jgi:hypothetical protein
MKIEIAAELTVVIFQVHESLRFGSFIIFFAYMTIFALAI